MTVSQPKQSPFRAFPVLIALFFNVVVGPAVPIVASAAADGIDDYAQCQIGNPKPVGLDCAEKWTNGILNATHNDYAEGEVVPQRLLMDFGSGSAGTSHSVTISYMARKDSGGQHHAYDYLATWNYTYVNADRCQTPTATDCIAGPPTTFPMPSDGNSVPPGGPQPTSTHELPPANRQFVMYGGTLTGTSAITHSVDPAEAGSDYGNVTVTFTVGAGGKVQLLFGGHLAVGTGPLGWGANLGSSSISGGPYHIRITAIDDESIGNRDNQIMSGAIEPLFPLLVVEKVADAATVSAGSNIGFTITVTNNGPGVANNATLNDPLPAGSGVDWAINPAYAGPGTCSITGSPPAETLTCAFGNLADDASASVHVQSATTAASCGEYPNTATADADNFDPVQASASTTVLCADIDVEKTPDLPGDPGGTVNAGGIATFTFVVTNNGLGVANDVTLEDTLPTVDAGWALGVDFDEEFCTLVVNDLDCAFGNLASGAFRTVEVWTPVTLSDCGNLINLDAFADTTNDGDDTDDGAILVTCPDLQISKSADDPEVNAGDPASYTITVSNGLGEGTAEDVVISDTLPAGLTWTDDSDDCTVTGGNLLSCGPLDILAGGSFSVTVTGTTDADDCPSILNRATFTSANAGSGQSHPEGQGAQITVNCPDILVEKTGSETVNATDSIFFEITVSNIGEGDAYDFAFTDTLPTIAGTWTLASFDNPPAECELIGLALSCSIPPDDIFLAGDLFTVRVEADTEFEDCGKLENLGSASASNEAEEDLENNSDTHDIVVECPDLTAEKDADDPETVSAGEDIGFTVTVSNSSDPGTGTAYDVVIDDPLPAGSGLDWEIDPAYAGPGTCEIQGSPGAETLFCELGDLDPGEGASVHVVSDTAPADCATYENVADITADNHPTLEPSDSTTVQCPGLNEAKVADPDTIDAGELATFDIVIWNTGPGTAFDVTLHDELPGDITWIELSDDCDIVAGVLDCSFGDLGVTTQENSPARVTVFGLTDREDCGVLDNTAIADANPGEPIEAKDSITVKCPEVSIVKSNDQPAPVLPGTVVSYTLHVTVSDGPADDVVVVDTLPLGLDDPTSISNGGVWDSPTRTITWTLGTLANGVHNLTYQAAVSLDAEHGDELTNVAVVTSSNSQCPDEETLADECEDDSTVTVRVPTLVIDKAANVELITKILDPQGNVISIVPPSVTWTLTYTLTNGPVTNAVITDPIPAGLTYVNGSASNGGVYNAGTKTLTWTFPLLSSSGFVTFQTTVNQDAPAGVILNVATIDSNETESDKGEDSIRIVEDQQLGGTSSAQPSLPSTALNQPSSGGSMAALLFGMILIAALGGLAYVNVGAVRRRR